MSPIFENGAPFRLEFSSLQELNPFQPAPLLDDFSEACFSETSEETTSVVFNSLFV